MFKKIAIFICALVALAGVAVFGAMGIKNHAITLDKAVVEAKSNVETQEKRRYDLIPNLVECVKQYDEHEYKTLKDVIAARKAAGQNVDVDEVKLAVEAVAEAYPELQSQKNYRDLMNELSNTENKISQYREFYNGTVMDYQLYTEQFPSKQVLGWLGYKPKDYQTLKYEHTSEDAPNVSDIFNRN